MPEGSCPQQQNCKTQQQNWKTNISWEIVPRESAEGIVAGIFSQSISHYFSSRCQRGSWVCSLRENLSSRQFVLWQNFFFFFFFLVPPPSLPCPFLPLFTPLVPEPYSAVVPLANQPPLPLNKQVFWGLILPCFSKSTGRLFTAAYLRAPSHMVLETFSNIFPVPGVLGAFSSVCTCYHFWPGLKVQKLGDDYKVAVREQLWEFQCYSLQHKRLTGSPFVCPWGWDIYQISILKILFHLGKIIIAISGNRSWCLVR